GCLRTFVYRHAGETPPGDVRLAAPFERTPWAGAIGLGDADGDGFWTVDVTLPPGEHAYKFIVDGQWSLDPDNPDVRDDGMGNSNSLARQTCPFTPDCLRDADCDAAAPLCRYYSCVDAEACRCPEGEVCDEAGRCVAPPECDDARPCDAPLVCRDGACGPECIDDTDCGDGELCRDLACVEPECMVDDDCDLAAEVCSAGLCAARPCRQQVFLYDAGGEDLSSVVIAGEFNGWTPDVAAGATPMRYVEALGAWFAVVELQNGPHAYKFVLTPTAGAVRWIADPAAARFEDDGFGGQNSVRDVDCPEEGPGVCGDLEAFDWHDAVMYFALIDRFYDSDGRSDPVPNASGGDAARGPSGQYAGGDLPGATAKLPYLDALGVTAVWLSAPYENRDAAGAAIDPASDPHTYSGYHGYWPSPDNIDYRDPDAPSPIPRVESRIGTSADLHAFVEAAHGSGIKVLFDYVMNHVDRDSGLYQAHPDWFATENGRFRLCGPENLWDDGVWGTLCAFTDYLPPFDFRNPAPRAWSVADALWWALEYGIDGYRLDAIKHVELSWLTELRSALNARVQDPDGGRFYLVGETFAYDDRDLLKRFVDPATKLDGQFDFPYKARLCEALFNKRMRLNDFAGWLDGNDGFYGPGALMTTWIGNHDIPRAIHFASGQIGDCRQGSHPGNGWTNDFPQPADAAAYERLGLAFVVMMTNPGIPLIYYGDEVGLAGGGDPDNRRMMPWDDGALLPPQRALRATVQALGRIRRDHKVLGRGRRITLSADEDTWVYRMSGCGDATPAVVVAINRADAERTVRVPAGAWQDLLADRPVAGGEVRLAARSALVLRPE
ncbi:MAG: hypothetical protein KC583_05415, partial [Myxococcales bacterium]|nr:hypothetical protein [Myxococcales bacterium]